MLIVIIFLLLHHNHLVVTAVLHINCATSTMQRINMHKVGHCIPSLPYFDSIILNPDSSYLLAHFLNSSLYFVEIFMISSLSFIVSIWYLFLFSWLCFRTCEICNSVARNVFGSNDIELTQHSNETNSATAPVTVLAPATVTETHSFWHGHRFLNFLLACMVFAFVLSWLFHFNVPSS